MKSAQLLNDFSLSGLFDWKKWHTAIPRASVASNVDCGSSFSLRMFFSIAATCSFDDAPCPVMAILTFRGEYSKIGI